MYYPDLEEVKKLKKRGNLVPVYREMMADLETPVSAYLKIAHGNYSFLLESVEGGERLARYSFIGTEPSLVIKTGRENPVDPLKLIEKEFQHYRPVPVVCLSLSTMRSILSVASRYACSISPSRWAWATIFILWVR